jgi:hypothetical protein
LDACKEDKVLIKDFNEGMVDKEIIMLGYDNL